MCHAYGNIEYISYYTSFRVIQDIALVCKEYFHSSFDLWKYIPALVQYSPVLHEN